jgi:hypothetical protein
MSYLIAYQPRAIAEHEAAALWYKERSIHAAENFETGVNKKNKFSSHISNTIQKDLQRIQGNTIR